MRAPSQTVLRGTGTPPIPCMTNADCEAKAGPDEHGTCEWGFDTGLARATPPVEPPSRVRRGIASRAARAMGRRLARPASFAIRARTTAFAGFCNLYDAPYCSPSEVAKADAGLGPSCVQPLDAGDAAGE